MAKFNITVDLAWTEDGYSIDEEIREAVVEGVKEELLKQASENAVAKVDKEIAEAVAKSKEVIEARIDEYIAAVCAEKIEQMKIPVKQNSWSNEVTYISMSEFIGERYEKFLNERRLNEHGEVPSYSGDKKYSVNEYMIRNYLGKELEGKVADMIQKARSQAEETVFKTLEQSLKENLAAETIKRMNIPQILKNMQKQNEEFKRIGDSNSSH